LLERAWGFESLRPHLDQGALHPPDVVARALRLGSEGRNAVEISRELAVPRRTIADWLGGAVPRHLRLPLTLYPPVGACARCGQQEHDRAGLPRTYVYLLGLYLGDGCISAAPRGVFKLRIVLDAKYRGIIDEAQRAVGDVMPLNKVTVQIRPKNCVELYAYSKAWPCLFPQHGPGKKHERTIALEAWQKRLVARSPDALLRGLIQSDGCRFMNTGRAWRHPRYSFCNRSEGIKEIFCAACEQLGLHWTRSGPKTIYVSRKADVAMLDRIVGPKY
jgi:hypothetical protein